MLRTFLVLLVLLSLFYILLQNKRIQTQAVKQFLNKAEKMLNTHISVKKADITFFNRIHLYGLYIEDLNKDTLLYIDKAQINFNSLLTAFQFNSRKIFLSKVEFTKAKINIVTDSTGTSNAAFIFKTLRKNRDVEKEKLTISMNRLFVFNSNISVNNTLKEVKTDRIDFSHLEFSHFQCGMKKVKMKGDSISSEIISISLKDKSGLEISEAVGDFNFSKKGISLSNGFVNTKNSKFSAENFEFAFNDFQSIKEQGFVNAVKLNIQLKNAYLDGRELIYFTPRLVDFNQTFIVSGNFTGTVNNLKGKDFELSFGDESYLNGNFNFDGLPDISKTFIVFDLKELQTNASDLESLDLPQETKIQLSDRFTKLGDIVYKGNFTGFIDDFVAFGKMETNLGNIYTDLLFKPDTSNYFSLNGNFSTRDFYIGELLGFKERMGYITMSAHIDGTSFAGETISARLEGVIDSFYVNNYNYTSIKLAGQLTNKTYDGLIEMKDPNLEFEFYGKVDISEDIPKYKFMASVSHADLYALHIDKQDPQHQASFYLSANAKGSSINTLDGEIKLLNSLFSKKNKQIQIYDFSLTALNTDSLNQLKIRSDFLDLDLEGSYKLDQAKTSIGQFLSSYLTTFNDTTSTSDSPILHSDFKITASFKHTRPFFEYFLPEYYIAENTIIKGQFYPTNKNLTLFIQSPQLVFKENIWNNCYIQALSNADALSLISGSKNLTLKNKIELDNFTIYSDAANDTMEFLARWNNWDTLLYKGSIHTKIHFGGTQKGLRPITFNIFPTDIITYDTLWHLAKGKVKLDTNGINIDKITIKHNNESIQIHGNVSKSIYDSIYFTFDQFNMANLNSLVKEKGFHLGGILEGKASLSNPYLSPEFYSDLSILNFTLNNQIFGNTVISSKWNNLNQSINLNLVANRGQLKTFELIGNYFPKDHKKLEFELNLNKLKLNLAEPYVSKLFSDVRGLSTGNLYLTGTLDKPVLNGDLNLQKASFTVDYLNTRYNFTNPIRIVHNNILLERITVYDNYGNSSVVDGIVKTEHLKNPTVSLTINAKSFNFLNTTVDDNNTYYGDAFASGIVRINGKTDDININVTATTDPNTRIYFPISNESDISEYDFIKIIQPSDVPSDDKQTYVYTPQVSGLQMNFDLAITPDAEVQMIFDPTLGEIIKSRGEGNIHLEVDNKGKLHMLGDYTIEKGEYLFTLQNVINKRLLVEQGGEISWNGEPLDADIDVKAVYPTKASLYDLLLDENYKYKRIPVNCMIHMTGKLKNPNISYDITLPTVEEELKTRLTNAITTEDEKNKQFLSLLVLNSFLPPEGPGLGNQGGNLNNGTSTIRAADAGVNASELLSNQLSNWLSQISNEFDIGFNYRPGEKENYTPGEIELALSTQLLNDRLSIDGNVDVTTNSNTATNAEVNQTNNIVGDVDIDYKLNKSGKLRLKAFNRSNDDEITESSLYTQGLGFFYKEEFNTLEELVNRYWTKLTGKENKEKGIKR